MQQRGAFCRRLWPSVQEVQVYVQVKNILARIPYLHFPPKSEKRMWLRLCRGFIWGSIFSGLVWLISRCSITLSHALKNKCMERTSLDRFILSGTFFFFFLFYSPLPFFLLCSSAAPIRNKSVTHKDTFSLIHYITALHAQPLQGSLTLDLCHQEHPILWPVLRPKGTLQTSCSLFPPGTKLGLCDCPLKMCGSALKCWPVQHF